MRLCNPLAVARAGASASRNVYPHSRRTAVSKISISMPPPRHKSHATQEKMTSLWAPHPLRPSSQGIYSLSHSSIPSKVASKTHIVYIALGSNLGDRIDMVERACNEMSARGIKIKRTSCLWETEPMYVLDQENFVNGACEVRDISFLGYPRFHL
jgi:2-amino-4-hydroxy-6-hydroxymethyldihydropteridine diphosphokinase/dihydropteroate synthase